MTRWRIGASELDRRIAKTVERHANGVTEKPPKILTLGGDQRCVLALSAGVWLLSRAARPDRRRFADHLLLCALATSILPPLTKRLVAQERPDRDVVHGRRHGIPLSGKRYDAFPSAHAMNVGALAAAFARLGPRPAAIAWSVAGLVAATRIALLAHWTSDVLAGLAMGAGLEHLLWKAGPRPKDERSG